MRVFDPAIQEWIVKQEEGAPVWIAGELRSSLGSGRIYVMVSKIQALNQL